MDDGRKYSYDASFHNMIYKITEAEQNPKCNQLWLVRYTNMFQVILCYQSNDVSFSVSNQRQVFADQVQYFSGLCDCDILPAVHSKLAPVHGQYSSARSPIAVTAGS